MTDLAPVYREAYPVFDVLEANAAYSEKEPREVCEYVTEKGYPAGQLFVDGSGIGIAICFHLYRPPYIPLVEDRCELRLVSAPSGFHEDRQLVLCEGCDRQTTKLYYKDASWLCAKCHGLFYRTQIVDRETRNWERRRELERLRKGGRPRHTRQSTFQAWMKELRGLETKLKGTLPREASQAHSFLIRHQWVETVEVEDLNFQAYCIRDGTIEPAPWFEKS